MKKRTLLPLLVLVVALLIFGAYRVYDRHITDTVAPKITIQEGSELLQISVNDPQTALLQGVTVMDARDGDVTDSVIIESVGSINSSHQATVTHAAFDKAGNVAKAQRTVQYTDYHSPRFTLSAPLAFPFSSQTSMLDCIGAEDVLEGDISYRVKATMMDETSISAIGTHNVLFRVTNNLGDTAELVLPVEVYDAYTHSGQLSLKEYIVYIPAGSSFEAKDYLDTFRFAGESINLTRGVPAELKLQLRGAVNVNEPGMYPVGFTVSTTRNEMVYSGYSKLIVVVEG